MKKGKIESKEWRQAVLTDDEEGDVTDVSGSNVATIGSSQDVVVDSSASLRASESTLYSIDSVSDSSPAGIPATSTSNLELDDVFTSTPGASPTVVTPSACVSSMSKNPVVSQSSADTFAAAESSEISTTAQIASSVAETLSSSDSLITESSDISTSALCASSTVGIPSSNTLANVESIEVCSSSAPNASSTTGMPSASIPATIDPSNVSTSAPNSSSVTDVSSAYTSASDKTTENNSTTNENLNATTSASSNFVTAETASTCISPSTEGTDESLSSPSLTSSNMDENDEETNLSKNKNPNIDMPILRSMLSQPSSFLPEKPWSFYEAQGYRRVSDDGSVRSRSPLSEIDSGERCAIQLPTTDVDKKPKEHPVENPSEVNEVNVRRMFDNMELLQTEQATDATGNVVEIKTSDIPATSSGAINTLDINEEVRKKVSDGAATTTSAFDNAAGARASSAMDTTADVPTIVISENVNDTINSNPTVAITNVVTTNTDSSCNIANAGSEDAASTQVTLSCTITNLTVIGKQFATLDKALSKVPITKGLSSSSSTNASESNMNPPNISYALDPASIEEDMRLIGEHSNEPTTEGDTTLQSSSLTELDSQIHRTRSTERIIISESPLRKRRFSLPGRSSQDEVNLGATTSTSQELEGDDDDNHHAGKRHRQHSLEGVQSVDRTAVVQTQPSEEKMDESKQAGDDVEKEDIDKDH